MSQKPTANGLEGGVREGQRGIFRGGRSFCTYLGCRLSLDAASFLTTEQRI